jgi:putative transposase
MPEYRRFLQKGGIVFLTIVTYKRQNIFVDENNIEILRQAVAKIKSEMPFEILGAVVLPDHLHFLWQLPPDDDNYSKRVGKIKVTFTKLFQQQNSSTEKISLSRQKHRESNIWQRRFWEHTIKDEFDFAQHLDYIHYNPIKHNLVSCPHLWKYSSFDMWVKKNIYSVDWCCVCHGKQPNIPPFEKIINHLGE